MLKLYLNLIHNPTYKPFNNTHFLAILYVLQDFHFNQSTTHGSGRWVGWALVFLGDLAQPNPFPKPKLAPII